MIVLRAAGLAVLALILVIAALLSQPPPAPVCPPLTWRSPPIRNPLISGSSAVSGTAVEHGQLYSNSQGFTVRYYPGLGVPPNSGNGSRWDRP